MRGARKTRNYYALMERRSGVLALFSALLSLISLVIYLIELLLVKRLIVGKIIFIILTISFFVVSLLLNRYRIYCRRKFHRAPSGI